MSLLRPSFWEVLRRVFFACFILLFCFNGCGLRGTGNTRRYTRAPYGIMQKEIPIYVDGSFGEADKVSLQQGIEQWNYALNGNIILKVEDWNYQFLTQTLQTQRLFSRGGFIIMNITSQDSYARGQKSTVLAFANAVPGNAIYFIRDRIKNEDMTALSLHEIGHILGAYHREHNLMEPIFHSSDYQCIDYETLKQVANQYKFDVKLGNYCYFYNE